MTDTDLDAYDPEEMPSILRRTSSLITRNVAANLFPRSLRKETWTKLAAVLENAAVEADKVLEASPETPKRFCALCQLPVFGYDNARMPVVHAKCFNNLPDREEWATNMRGIIVEKPVVAPVGSTEPATVPTRSIPFTITISVRGHEVFLRGGDRWAWKAAGKDWTELEPRSVQPHTLESAVRMISILADSYFQKMGW
mgnify:CR=1 FL=1